MKPRVYIVWMGREAYPSAIRAARDLRRADIVAELAPVEQKVGKALGQAEKRDAHYALILGDDEVASGQYTVKKLSTGTQEKVQKDRLVEYIKRQFE